MVRVKAEEGKEVLSAHLKTYLTRDTVYLCIGTERVPSDSLGPRVGEKLNSKMQSAVYVYGMTGSNITAQNLQRSYEFIRALHPTQKIAVIDAAVGESGQVGDVQIDNGIIPGAATGKNFARMGEVSIIGIVASSDMKDFYTDDQLRRERVETLATDISDAILSALQAEETPQTAENFT